MDHKTSSKKSIILIALISLACVPIYVGAQVSDTVTITACVDDGMGTCSGSSGNNNNGGNTGGNTGGGNSGGGGGGGGFTSIIQSHESAVFKGLAYPGSLVSLVQNGTIVTEVPASPNGTFEIKVYNLGTGTYTFGIVAEDSNRQRSTIQTYTIYLAQNVSTQVAGIFIPPTISTDKIETRHGDPVTFFGKAAPNATVTISIHSAKEIIKKVLSDASGGYLYRLDTTDLELGDHESKSKAVTEDDISPYSSTVTFTVGTKNVSRSVVIPTSRKCDLNNDNRVNLLDFSIMAYWYKRTGFPAKVDLNNDKRIDLSDVSILAYCWTG